MDNNFLDYNVENFDRQQRVKLLPVAAPNEPN